MKKYLILLLSGVLTTSCIDTVVLPTDVTIGEDYWKSKSDVTGMVMGAYKAMCSADAIERCVVWGDFRSDELVPFGGSTNVTKINDLVKIHNGNMDYTNTYATWLSFYSVINKCNIVLDRGHDVVSIDPSYNEQTWLTDQSQMLALRSLCYFYLVRAFRDVPYSTAASMNSSQSFVLPQEAPLTVINNCIADCETALKHALSPTAYTDWRKVGLFTKDGINALLADLYLWRASMTHSQADYSSCVEYCNAVIQSKREQYPADGINASKSDFPLEEGMNAYVRIFSQGNSFGAKGGNSKESIFELQMDGSNDSNAGIRNCFWNNGDNTTTYKLMRASGIFAPENADNGVFLSASKDYRYYDAVFDVSSSSEASDFGVRKMVSLDNITNRTESNTGRTDATEATGRANNLNNIAQNWIFYRLTDVMLMKAEAMVQLASDAGDDENLSGALYLVNAVYKRSLTSSAEADTLKASDYTTKDALEKLVLQERLRELCFEGKRWFDLLRYNYRHVEGIQPNLTMAEISQGGKGTNAFVTNYDGMMTLMERKYVSGGAQIGSKMSTEAHLYFPIAESELIVNSLLKQNPAYEKNDSYVKN